MLEFTYRLSICIIVPKAAAIYLNPTFHTTRQFLHHLDIYYVLKITIKLQSLIQQVFITLANPSSYCSLVILFLLCEVFIESFKHELIDFIFYLRERYTIRRHYLN